MLYIHAGSIGIPITLLDHQNNVDPSRKRKHMSNDVTEDSHRIASTLDRMFQRADSLPDSADPCTETAYLWHGTPFSGPHGLNVLDHKLPMTCIRSLGTYSQLVEEGADSVVALLGDHDIPSQWHCNWIYLCGIGARRFVVQFFTPGYVEKVGRDGDEPIRFPYKIVGRGWVTGLHAGTKTDEKMYAIVYKEVNDKQVTDSKGGKDPVS